MDNPAYSGHGVPIVATPYSTTSINTATAASMVYTTPKNTLPARVSGATGSGTQVHVEQFECSLIAGSRIACGCTAEGVLPTVRRDD